MAINLAAATLSKFQPFHLLKSFPIYDDLLSEYLVNAINDFLTLVMTFIPNMRGKADLKR